MIKSHQILVKNVFRETWIPVDAVKEGSYVRQEFSGEVAMIVTRISKEIFSTILSIRIVWYHTILSVNI